MVVFFSLLEMYFVEHVDGKISILRERDQLESQGRLRGGGSFRGFRDVVDVGLLLPFSASAGELLFWEFKKKTKI